MIGIVLGGLFLILMIIFGIFCYHKISGIGMLPERARTDKPYPQELGEEPDSEKGS